MKKEHWSDDHWSYLLWFYCSKEHPKFYWVMIILTKMNNLFFWIYEGSITYTDEKSHLLKTTTELKWKPEPKLMDFFRRLKKKVDQKCFILWKKPCFLEIVEVRFRSSSGLCVKKTMWTLWTYPSPHFGATFCKRWSSNPIEKKENSFPGAVHFFGDRQMSSLWMGSLLPTKWQAN